MNQSIYKFKSKRLNSSNTRDPKPVRSALVFTTDTESHIKKNKFYIT